MGIEGDSDDGDIDFEFETTPKEIAGGILAPKQRDKSQIGSVCFSDKVDVCTFEPYQPWQAKALFYSEADFEKFGEDLDAEEKGLVEVDEEPTRERRDYDTVMQMTD